MKSKKEIKHYKVKELPVNPTPDSVYYVKPTAESVVTAYITNLNGVPYELIRDGGGNGVVKTITNTDGRLTIVGDEDIFINFSPSMIAALNLKADDNSVIHTTGDEVKNGNLTLNNDLILPSIQAPLLTTNNLIINDLGEVLSVPAETATSGAIKVSVTNKTGSTITKGSAVYINGAQGSKATIALALADNNIDTSLALGIVENNIANNASGYVVALGEITNINTASFSNGAKVFVSSTIAGGLTITPPTSPNNVVSIGTVTNSHATQGKILINVLYTFKLDRLVDVAITSPTDRQILMYETLSGLWKDSSLNSLDITTALGFTPENNANKTTDLTSPDNTKYPTTLAVTNGLSLKEDTANKGVANGYASLGSDGFVPLAQTNPSVIERLTIVADQAARFTLTTTTVQNGDTVKQVSPDNTMYYVKDDTNLNSELGYEIYRAGSAATVPWSGVTNTPTTLSGYGILDAENVTNKVDIISGSSSVEYPTEKAVVDYVDAKLGQEFTKIIYFNSTDPSTATIFDIANPPVTNDNALKNDVNNLYVGTDGSTWVYKTSPAGYITKTVSASSNFYVTGTTTDAGSIKTGSITKKGELVVDSGTSNVSGFVLNKIPGILSSPSSYGTGLTPRGLVVLANNDILAVDQSAGQVKLIASGGGVATTYGTGLTAPTDIVLLPNGDVLVANTGTGGIFRIPFGGGAAVSWASVSSPRYLATLPNGHILLTNGTSNVFRITSAGAGAVSYGSGVLNPRGIAVLSNGDALVVIPSTNSVLRIPYNAGAGGAAVAYGTGLNNPIDICILPNGDALVSNGGDNTISKIPSGGGVAIPYATGLSSPQSIAISSTSDIFVSNSGTSTVVKLSTVANKPLTTDTTGKVVKTTYLEDVQYLKTTDASGTLISQTITDGDATHAPSGDVVFDALALKTDETRTLNVNGNSYDLSANREWRTAQADTGCLTSVGLTANSGTTINIGAVTGYIVDNETNPDIPTYSRVNYAGATNVTVTTVGSGLSSYVMLGVGGITFQTSFPTSAERKAKIWLGKVGHPTGTITTVINEPDYITSPQAFSRDLFQALSPYINNNVYPYANGANLNVNITGGQMFGNGINFVNSRTNPNSLTVGATVATPFLYRTQLGGSTGAVTDISPGFYDNAGVITAIGGAGARSTIQYVFAVPGQGFVIQYGQVIYANLNNAVEAVTREPFIIFPNLIGNAILIGVIAVRRDATQLNNTAQALFFKADKFGQLIGATSGTSTGTLQTAYNNSPLPQIIPTDDLGAFTLKNGRALDTSSVFEVKNIASTTTASITGNGDLQVNTISAYASSNVQAGTTYTLVASDNGKQVVLTNSSAVTVTIPSGLPTGFNCSVHQQGLGQVTFVASSTTLRYSTFELPSTVEQYAMVGIENVTNVANTYKLYGQLTSI